MLYLFSYFFFFLFFSFFLYSLFLTQDFSYVVEVVVPYFDLSGMGFIFVFDYISLLFFSSVCLISSVVFLYSNYYMSFNLKSGLDLVNNRFFVLLFLFVMSMGFVVFSGSWVTVMLGWDGLGLVSFLLVIFYNNTNSLDSGVITFLTNRIGDCLFIISFMFFFLSGWVSYDFLGVWDCFVFMVLIFLGCVTKSAQFPFSSWLPAAMAAPTPVSSLVHSSTLVTAGVYLMIRFNYLISSSFCLAMFLSLVTMFLGGLCACYELDFKKVVAMSTLSQLGFMIFSVSCGFWLFSFFHMVFHAFFKSILFLSTGCLMHDLSGAQDSRFFGSLGFSFFSKVLFSLSSLSLMGFPFSLGFFTKDAILGCLFFDSFSFIFFIFFVSCCFTVAYSFRIIFMGFSEFSSFSSFFSSVLDFYFYFPIIFLYFYCVFFGNYFFFNFFPVFNFSFLDFFLGIFVIFLGLIFSFFIPNIYFFVVSFSGIFFLSFFSSSFLSRFSFFDSYKLDSSWSEIFGGKGLLLEFNSLLFYVFSFYNLKFSSLMIIVFAFSCFNYF